jgi:hypothetical protein
MSVAFRELPAGLESLWDMINLRLRWLVDLMRRFEIDRLTLKARNSDGDGALQIDAIIGAAIQANLKLAEVVFDNFSDKNVAHALDELAKSVGHVKNNVEVYAKLEALFQSIEVFFCEQLVYAVEPKKAEVLFNWTSDWQQVYEAFHDAKADVFDGVVCWSLERNTASVFHMMRVLEYGLLRLSEEVEVVFDTQTWHKIIDQIETKIGVLQDTITGPSRKERLQFLSEAAKEFRYFKDGWRNYVAHNRVIYDKQQARSVIEHVRAFMTILSTKLKTDSSAE